MKHGNEVATVAAKKRKRAKRKKAFLDMLCVLPVVIYFVVMIYYPLADLLHTSFTDWNLLRKDYGYVGTKNWEWLFQGNGRHQFVETLTVTAIYTFGEVIITLIGGMALAHLFNRQSRFFNALRSVLVLPKYISVSTIGVVFVWLMNDQYGLFNQFLVSFGWEPVRWLTSSDNAIWSVITVAVWRNIGYTMIIYLSAMKGISTDYYEAAALDGAGSFKRWRYITFPLLAPTTLFLFVTTFLGAMNVFQTVDVMTEGGPYGSTKVIAYWIYDLAFDNYRIDRAACVSIAFFVILMVFTMLTMRWSKYNVNYDA